MSKLRCHISISADGFVAGPSQSEENPLGEGGERLHGWAVSLATWRESHDKQGGEVPEPEPVPEVPAEPETPSFRVKPLPAYTEARSRAARRRACEW